MNYFGLSIKLSRSIKEVLHDCLVLESFREAVGFSGQYLETDEHVLTAFKAQ